MRREGSGGGREKREITSRNHLKPTHTHKTQTHTYGHTPSLPYQISDATLQAQLRQPLTKLLPELDHDESELVDAINTHLQNLDAYRISVKTKNRERWRCQLSLSALARPLRSPLSHSQAPHQPLRPLDDPPLQTLFQNTSRSQIFNPEPKPWPGFINPCSISCTLHSTTPYTLHPTSLPNSTHEWCWRPRQKLRSGPGKGAHFGEEMYV